MTAAQFAFLFDIIFRPVAGGLSPALRVTAPFNADNLLAMGFEAH